MLLQATLCGFLWFSISASGQSGRGLAAEITTVEHRVLSDVNGVRRMSGLPELRWNKRAAEEARRHAERMAAAGFFGHTDPSRGSPGDRLAKAGIKWRRYAENLYQSKGIAGPVEDAMKSWLESPEHRKNIMDPNLTETGVGAAFRQDGTLFVVQEFVTPMPPGAVKKQRHR